MTKINKTAVSLRFFGEDLDPKEVTDLLGGLPTFGVEKNGVWLNSRGEEIIARNGQWRLTTERRSPGDLDGQIAELFGALSDDLSTWNNLCSRFQADVFCGLFLKELNEGISLLPETLSAVGARGLSIGLDIYGPDRVD